MAAGVIPAAGTDHAARAADLEQRILGAIPLAAAMQVRVTGFDGVQVELSAPLAPNLNDKGTGFAGSLATLATLAGWSLATLLAEQALQQARCATDVAAVWSPCEAAVFRSNLEFLRPVREPLVAVAWLADDTVLAGLPARLAAGRRAKLAIDARLGPAGDPALQFSGHYAVWRAGAQPF